MRYGVIVFLCFFYLASTMAYAKDPTQPIPYSSDLLMSSTSSLQLDGIISGSGRLLAIINGESHDVGTQLSHWTVTQITSNKVVLRDNQQQLTLELIPSVKETCTGKGCSS